MLLKRCRSLTRTRSTNLPLSPRKERGRGANRRRRSNNIMLNYSMNYNHAQRYENLVVNLFRKSIFHSLESVQRASTSLIKFYYQNDFFSNGYKCHKSEQYRLNQTLRSWTKRFDKQIKLFMSSFP